MSGALDVDRLIALVRRHSRHGADHVETALLAAGFRPLRPAAFHAPSELMLLAVVATDDGPMGVWRSRSGTLSIGAATPRAYDPRN